jgi:DNA polymerase-3 subunit delta'
MESATTRGQPGALAAIAAMVSGYVPHAVLLVGPASSGKTTLALDLAAALLCLHPDRAARPCRACRGCRLVASGNHPDLHRLAPEGPGREVRIGKAGDPEPGTIRHLIGELALLPVEGGARVAIVEQAHRINDDAQNALLKMLEEPPAGVTIVLCADEEECLLPTVRSRCVRVRLGPVAGREIERWLGELGAADAPSAARYARLASGCPGLALAYARAPEAARLRGEMARGLLDLLTAGRHERLTSVRALMTSAAALEAALDEGRKDGAGAGDGAGEGAGNAGSPATGRRRKKAAAAAAAPAAPSNESGEGELDGPVESAAPKASATERRAAASALLAIWASVARDLAVAALGGRRHVHDPELLDELAAVAPTLPRGAMPAFLTQLAAVEAQIDENVNPELALDVLALAWPRPGGNLTPGATRRVAAS